MQRLLPDLSPEDQQRLDDGKSVSLIKYAETHWHPQLYIENALGDLKEQIRYSAKRSRDDQHVYVCEHRDIKGLFWEKLELDHFPSDVQDLSISIGSMFYDDKVLLVKDPYHLSGVNREAFVDQQEWSLYEHVDVEQRFIREFLFRDAGEYDDDDSYGADGAENDDRKRSILTVTCHAGGNEDDKVESERVVSVFFSSSIALLLLERLLFGFSHYERRLLHLRYSPTVRLDSCSRTNSPLHLDAILVWRLIAFKLPAHCY